MALITIVTGVTLDWDSKNPLTVQLEFLRNVQTGGMHSAQMRKRSQPEVVQEIALDQLLVQCYNVNEQGEKLNQSVFVPFSQLSAPNQGQLLEELGLGSTCEIAYRLNSTSLTIYRTGCGRPLIPKLSDVQ